MKAHTNSDLIVVYKGNPDDAEIIKQILADNGIAVNLKNQLMGSIAPWHVTPGGFEPVEIEVLEKDKEKVLELIKEFKKSN